MQPFSSPSPELARSPFPCRRLLDNYEYFGAAAEGRTGVALSESRPPAPSHLFNCPPVTPRCSMALLRPNTRPCLRVPRRLGANERRGLDASTPACCSCAEPAGELEQQELAFLADFVQVAETSSVFVCVCVSTCVCARLRHLQPGGARCAAAAAPPHPV